MNRVIGYAFNKDGYYRDKYYFGNSYENIANFIMQFGADSPRIIITDISDNLLVATYGIYLDKIDQSIILEDLLSVLIPMQKKEKEYTTLQFENTEPGVMVHRER